MNRRPIVLIVGLAVALFFIWRLEQPSVEREPAPAPLASTPPATTTAPDLPPSPPVATAPTNPALPVEPLPSADTTIPLPDAREASTTTGSSAPRLTRPGTGVVPGAPIVPPPAATSATTPAPEMPEKISEAGAASDLDEVRVMLQEFRSVLGENPVGNNAEIMAAINGGNLKQARIGPPANQRLNDQGELIDRWGTPYFFHQLSRIEMEIRSAGADRTMWTNDDVIAK